MESIHRVFLPSFQGNVDFKEASLNLILDGEEALCSIVVDRGVVSGVVQEVQNWFTGIPNPTRSLKLG